MLLREMMSDPFLEHYGVVVIDQAHHRTVSTDVLLGLLRDILLHRPELRVVLLTVDHMADRLLRHYGRVPLIRLESTSAAQVVHSSSGGGGSRDYFYAALRLVLEIHRTREEGDVTVFLASSEVRAAGRERRRAEREVGGLTAVCLPLCLPAGGPVRPQHPKERRHQAGSGAGPAGARGLVSCPGRGFTLGAAGLPQLQDSVPLHPAG